jgi:hypothetical protein
MKKILAFFLALATVAFAQQPQTSSAPIYSVNAKYVQGFGPGYWPTAGSGLVLNVAAGTANCAGPIVTYAGGTLTMTASTTNYVYLDESNFCVPAVSTTVFTSSVIPIATVVAGASAITSITDDRTMFQEGGGTNPIVVSTSNGVAAVSCPTCGTSSGGTVVSVNGGSAVSTLNATGSIPVTCSDTSGSSTAQSCTTTPSFTPTAGNCITYLTTTANTGTALTINVNSSAAGSVAKWAGSTTTLVAGDIPANKPIPMCFDAAGQWDVMTIGNAPSGGGLSPLFDTTNPTGVNTPAEVQSISAASTTATFSSNIKAGDLLLVFSRDYEGSSITVSDSLSTSFTLATAVGARVYMGTASSSGVDTITLTGAVDAPIIVAYEFSGVTETIDNAASSSTGTSITLSATTSYINDLLVSYLNQDCCNEMTLSVSSGWSTPVTAANSVYTHFASSYEIGSSAGANSITWTSTNRATAYLFSLRAASTPVSGSEGQVYYQTATTPYIPWVYHSGVWRQVQ